MFRLTLLGLSRTDSWPTVTRNLSVNPLKPLANTFCLLFRQFRVPFSSFSLSLSAFFTRNSRKTVIHEIKRSLCGLILLSNQFGRWQSVHHNINKLPRVLFAFLAKIMKNIARLMCSLIFFCLSLLLLLLLPLPTPPYHSLTLPSWKANANIWTSTQTQTQTQTGTLTLTDYLAASS